MKPTHRQYFLFSLLLVLILCPFVELWAQAGTTATERIAARFAGPFHLRFIFQPLIAIILGTRDGRTDAKLGTPPYIFEIFTDKANRRSNLKKGLQAITTPLVIGIILDAIVQFNLFHTVHFFGALLVGGFLVGLPYSLARGIRNRLEQKYGEKAKETT